MNFNTSVVRQLLTLLILLPVLLLSSCVEGDEEIWINPDASGRLVSHYEIPSFALAKIGAPEDLIRALKMIDEREDGIEITAVSFKIKGGKAIFHLDATFEDVRKLVEISDRNKEVFIKETGTDPEQMDSVAGGIEFGLKGLTPTFNRSMSLDGMIPSYISPSLFGPSHFKHTIHLPVKIKETNAHSVSEDRRTVSWTFLLKDHFKHPMEMEFTTELPIPWWAWAILAVLVFGLAWLIWRRFLRA